jgi:hypothetical protein
MTSNKAPQSGSGCVWEMPTSSRFGDVYTATGKASASAEGYMYSLLAEIFAGEPAESYTSEAMERGTMLEPEAVSAYELIKDVETQVIGFVTNDEEPLVARLIE